MDPTVIPLDLPAPAVTAGNVVAVCGPAIEGAISYIFIAMFIAAMILLLSSLLDKPPTKRR